jgi:hypothetical protein
MAWLVLGTYMIQFPMGGMLSSRLPWLVGLTRSEHELCVFERSRHRLNPSSSASMGTLAKALKRLRNGESNVHP